MSQLTQTRFSRTTKSELKRVSHLVGEATPVGSSVECDGGASDPERTPVKRRRVEKVFKTIEVNCLEKLEESKQNVIGIVSGLGSLREVQTRFDDDIWLRDILISTPFRSNFLITLFGPIAKMRIEDVQIETGEIVFITNLSIAKNRFRDLRMSGKSTLGTKIHCLITRAELANLTEGGVHTVPHIIAKVQQDYPELPPLSGCLLPVVEWAQKHCCLLIHQPFRQEKETSSPSPKSVSTLLSQVSEMDEPMSITASVRQVEVVKSKYKSYAVLWLDDGSVSGGEASVRLRVPLQYERHLDPRTADQEALLLEGCIVQCSRATRTPLVSQEKVKLEVSGMKRIDRLPESDPRAQVVRHRTHSRDCLLPSRALEPTEVVHCPSLMQLHKIIGDMPHRSEKCVQVPVHQLAIKLGTNEPFETSKPIVDLVCCFCGTSALVERRKSENRIGITCTSCTKLDSWSSFPMNDTSAKTPDDAFDHIVNSSENEFELLFSALISKWKQKPFLLTGFRWRYLPVKIDLIGKNENRTVSEPFRMECSVEEFVLERELFLQIPPSLFGFIGMESEYQKLALVVQHEMLERITSASNPTRLVTLKLSKNQGATSIDFLEINLHSCH